MGGAPAFDELVKELLQALNEEEPQELPHEEEALYDELHDGKINLHFLLAYKQGLEEEIEDLEQRKAA